jgi:hypothetical protein
MKTIPLFAVLFVVAALPLATTLSADAEKPAGLTSARVDKAPAIDGKADDPAWSKATPLDVVARKVMPPDPNATTKVTLRSVHTDTEIYFLITWDDSTESVSHKTWLWNKEKKAYEEGPDREDMLSLGLELKGVFNPDMLAGEPAVWDVWHWKAFRTNPQDYAMDKTHHYTLEKPSLKANEHKARNGKTGSPDRKTRARRSKSACPRPRHFRATGSRNTLLANRPGAPPTFAPRAFGRAASGLWSWAESSTLGTRTTPLST